jgi:tetratricopeptide (TPR) repeat protein
LEALAIRERTLLRDHVDIARSLSRLGNVYIAAGKLAEAEPVLLRAEAMYERLGQSAGVLADLARLYRQLGRLPEAEAFYKRNLARLDAQSPNDTELLRDLTNLGGLYADQGRFVEAERS